MIDAAYSGWEAVHTVNDYYDGPRNGIADYRWAPHVYKCVWDDSTDDWSVVFLLSPITPEQMSAVEEAWSIWRRYRANFQQGNLLPGDEHPALEGDWPRHEQLRGIVDDALVVDEARAVRAVPEFRGTIEPEHDFEVRWQSCSE